MDVTNILLNIKIESDCENVDSHELINSSETRAFIPLFPRAPCVNILLTLYIFVEVLN